MTLKDGDRFTFTTDDVVGDDTKVSVNYRELAHELEPGDTILLSNGLLSFRDDTLPQQAAFGNQLFLNGRQLLEGNLHTHIAARHHDAVARGAYFLDIVHAGLVLDFGYQINIGTAVRLHKLADIQQILLAGDKGTGNIIHAVLDAEGKIALVLLVEIHLPEHLAGKAHALVRDRSTASRRSGTAR